MPNWCVITQFSLNTIVVEYKSRGLSGKVYFPLRVNDMNILKVQTKKTSTVKNRNKLSLLLFIKYKKITIESE